MNLDVAHQESGIISPNNRLTSVVPSDSRSKDNTEQGANGVSTICAPIEANTQSKPCLLPPHLGLMKVHSLNVIGMFFEPHMGGRRKLTTI